MSRHFKILPLAQYNGDRTIEIPNAHCKGLIMVVDITNLHGGAPTLTITIRGKDKVSGKTWTILASAALAAVATTVLRIYPGLTAAANLVASDVLPQDLEIFIDNNDTNISGSISVYLVD